MIFETKLKRVNSALGYTSLITAAIFSSACCLQTTGHMTWAWVTCCFRVPVHEQVEQDTRALWDLLETAASHGVVNCTSARHIGQLSSRSKHSRHATWPHGSARLGCQNGSRQIGQRISLVSATYFPGSGNVSLGRLGIIGTLAKATEWTNRVKRARHNIIKRS